MDTQQTQNFKETHHMPRLKNALGKLSFLKDGEVMKMIFLALLVVGGLLGVIQVFSTPTQAREIQARIYEIQEELQKKELLLTNVQTEWAKVDLTHQELERTLAEVVQKKREIEEGGGIIRFDMDSLRKEKEELTRQLASFNAGLALGR